MAIELERVGDTILGTTFLSAGAWTFAVETALPGYVMIAGGLLLTLRVIKTSMDILKDRRDRTKEDNEK